jgi:beta-N-acetylhexosaminidase
VHFRWREATGARRAQTVPMIRRRAAGLVLVLVFAVVLAAGGALTAPSAAPQQQLSTRQLAGQRVIYSYPGLTPPATLLEKIRAGEAAGVIFFGENIASRAQIRGVIGKLQQAAAQSPVKAPLLLMTDQEGGTVRRLTGAPAVSEKRVGAAADSTSAAEQAGRGAGLNLKGVGMNVNLAPVLDVYRAPGNFIDRFGRSYSRSPRTVARLGVDFIRAQQRTGVAATAKHFPGLGAATRTQNTDESPVTLRLSLGTLRAVDELPYSSAVASAVRLVMVSSATYPALDPGGPAGLSSAVVQGELRKRLKFAGVTISDALEAGALRAFGSVSNRAVLAARAGIDLLLCSARSVQQGTSAVSALAAARRSGRLNASSFDAAAKRVIALRSALAG